MKGFFGAALSSVILVACAPTRSPLSPSEPPPQVVTQECSGARVQLTVTRKPNNALVYEVYATDLSGLPLADVTRVVLTFTSTDGNASMTTSVTQPTADRHYVSRSGFTVMAGPWKVETIVRRTSAPEIVCTFSFNF